MIWFLFLNARNHWFINVNPQKMTDNFFEINQSLIKAQKFSCECRSIFVAPNCVKIRHSRPCSINDLNISKGVMMSYPLLLASGCLIILSCFSASLLWMNWSQSRTRKLFAFLTIVLVMLSVICIYFLFQRIWLIIHQQHSRIPCYWWRNNSCQFWIWR